MKLTKKISNSKFAKNVILLSGGTAIAQILTILLSPVLTRLYSPEQFGVLSLFISIVTIIGLGSTLEYSKAVVVARDEIEAMNLFVVSSLLLFLTTIFFSSILIVVSIGDYFQSSAMLVIKDSIWLLSVGIYLIGLYELLTNWAIRNGNFIALTKTKVTQSITSNLSKIVISFTPFNGLGLLIGHVLGQSGGIVKLFKMFISDFRRTFSSLSLKGMKNAFIKHKDFPLYSLPSNYVYTVGNHIPIIFFSIVFGTTAAGYFGFANSIINLPIALIANSAAQVFYSEVSKIGKDDPSRIMKLSWNITSKLTIIGLIPLIILTFFAPYLFSLIFGQEWLEAGEFARFLAFVSFAHFVILPIGRVLSVLGKQRIGLYFNIVRLCLIITSFMYSFFTNMSDLETIILYSIVSSVSYFLLFFVVQYVLYSEKRG
ncbi:oligosaccharide flippase family protein [Exiguobacterium sp. s55]|uniref:oligosaccharide flippase family protein n=1 Tax=Exiguobacterium sp. s55 TaxID=2751245 RepID=UPI001BEC56B1|nr:oligosaccharide flippase family protein [Exiguobacterium sp. s55]